MMHAFGKVVATAIDLYGETDCGAVEIENIRTDRVLPAEAQPVEFIAAQPLPHDNLGQGHLPSRQAGTLDRYGWRAHASILVFLFCTRKSVGPLHRYAVPLPRFAGEDSGGTGSGQ